MLFHSSKALNLHSEPLSVLASGTKIKNTSTETTGTQTPPADTTNSVPYPLPYIAQKIPVPLPQNVTLLQQQQDNNSASDIQSIGFHPNLGKLSKIPPQLQYERQVLMQRGAIEVSKTRTQAYRNRETQLRSSIILPGESLGK